MTVLMPHQLTADTCERRGSTKGTHAKDHCEGGEGEAAWPSKSSSSRSPR